MKNGLEDRKEGKANIDRRKDGKREWHIFANEGTGEKEEKRKVH
jgi:hypothetical protein